ncbi:MAG TPA: hypothetical protein VH165_19775 [Kofleriaceae bacterium]|nr:hypothetical protein [Kofleriaceae bacterium]
MRERGEDVSHVPAREQARYDALVGLFAALPGATPPPGWKQRILAAFDAPAGSEAVLPVPDLPPVAVRPARRRWPAWQWFALAGSMAALAIVVVVWNLGIPRRAGGIGGGSATVAVTEPVVTTEVRRGDRPHRSGPDSTSIGDTLVIHVAIGQRAELRVYGDTGEPLARCTETAGCTVERDGELRRFHLELALQSSGDVRAVLFTGAALPPGFAGLNLDVEAAQAAGGHAQQVAMLHVQ